MVFIHLLLFTKSEETGAGVEFQLIKKTRIHYAIWSKRMIDVTKEIRKKVGNYTSIESKP